MVIDEYQRQEAPLRRRGGPLAADESTVLSVRVPNALFDAIAQLADQDGMKPAELIRALLTREVRARLRRAM